MKETIDLDTFRKWGKQGGKKRAAKMTTKSRKESARKAARARWSKRRKR